MPRKYADYEEFMYAQVFFERMTHDSMKEYIDAGALESVIVALSEEKAEDGKRCIEGAGIDNVFEEYGLYGEYSVQRHAAARTDFLETIEREDKKVIAVFERHLFRSEGRDTLVTDATYGGTTVRRSFSSIGMRMSVDANGIHEVIGYSETGEDSHSI